MTKPIVWGSVMSQPTRAVLWTALLSRVEIDFRPIDTGKGDHLTPEFLKLNPNKKFPVVQDGNFVLHESHAIMKYLLEKYAPADVREQLYPPSDLEARSRIDTWLDWKHNFLRPGACGLIRRRVMRHLLPDVSKHSMVWDLKEIPAEREERMLLDSLKVMDDQIAAGSYIAGTNSASLADIALFTEISQLDLLPQDVSPPHGCDFSKDFPNVHAWSQRLRALEGYETIISGFTRAQPKVEALRSQGKL
ncbi:Glutathione S-transferase [Hondaea fermentalgiana]|uniref:Glutathione S-transferase n=1 Tax=Hondaea fermentalgiana TaxID=2315210 RepID=A0A2R5GCS4_9STRA|nr:Glutathione S-transferase [Hondaea fermentalgiana]|eukprot:GBG28787.1 Glutathione S-transferase [Hondaea fermentalgiana]